MGQVRGTFYDPFPCINVLLVRLKQQNDGHSTPYQPSRVNEPSRACPTHASITDMATPMLFQAGTAPRLTDVNKHVMWWIFLPPQKHNGLGPCMAKLIIELLFVTFVS